MRKISLLLPLCAVLLLGACAGRMVPPPPAEVPTTPSSEARAEMERKAEEQAREKEQLFEIFSAKTDEYQSLLATCDSLSDSEEDRKIKAACMEELKTLRRELLDLAASLQEGP